MPTNLIKLLDLLREMPAYGRLLSDLGKGDISKIVAVLSAAKPYLLASLYYHLHVPMLVVTAQPEDARKLHEQLGTWLATDEVQLLPEPEVSPYELIIPDSSLEVERLCTLSILSGMSNDTENTEVTPALVVTSVLAFVQKVPSYQDFTRGCHTIHQGMEADPLQLLQRWQSIGYRLEDIVEVPGAISHRGGIVDIFPPTSEKPVRLEFFGNTVESIRLFNPRSQRSQSPVTAVNIGPAAELLSPFVEGNQRETEVVLRGIDTSGLQGEIGDRFQRELAVLRDGGRPQSMQLLASLFNKGTILDYLPFDALLVLDEMDSIRLEAEDIEVKAGQLHNDRVTKGEMPAGLPKPYFTSKELVKMLEQRDCLKITAWQITGSEQYSMDFSPAPRYAGQLPSFLKKVPEMIDQKQRLIIVSHQAQRLSELLAEEDIITAPINEVKETPTINSLTLVQGLLGEGWVMNGDTRLLTDTEIFGFIKQRRLPRKRAVSHLRLFIDITPGDYVVHIEHGIARFAGVITMSADNGEKEYLVLEYAEGDRLYVPTDQIDRVGRYIGAGERQPILSRLGTQEWTRLKKKVKESVEVIAHDLLNLYATREVVSGYAYSPDTVWQQELEASFPYVETPDQLEAQQQVKEDMQRRKPMDRLVCGDVGYGKTEVAIRAAFKAVMDDKQVAVLVPTTVLAEQHLATFSERLGAFPLRVEVLSRFRTPKEQADILGGLATGKVDICIGTHRLLQKDVVFRNLGLLIVDEEQRFGVNHKEHLKKMRQEVDVLTLSATPIPRTLHMSLVGVRDMSLMETPPEDRLPIKTYVAEYNDYLVREAIIREIERNGQVFFVHNRVQSIVLVAEKLRELVPEARIVIGHGQMPEVELEQVMADFIRRKSDILVCTTIIESGLDMPSVNTLIVNRADKFGLTQLYQLRGRVGRGANLAHAYFLYDKGQRLSPVAELRLKAIMAATELGAGYGIAMRDLEIRGAGNLLGVKQSGHISAVGFNLYCQLLAQAVEEQKKGKTAEAVAEAVSSELPLPIINLPLSAYIPQNYVYDLNTRIALYQKLVEVKAAEQAEELLEEFTDRFGAPPDEVHNLLYVLRVRALASVAGVESIDTEKGNIVVRLFQGMRLDKTRLGYPNTGIQIGNTRLSLNLRTLGKRWRSMLIEVLSRLG